MLSTRRFLAFAAFGAAGLLPSVTLAQSDPGADDLMKRLRGAPGGRVGGATRGIKCRFEKLPGLASCFLWDLHDG